VNGSAAIELIRDAVAGTGGTWADLGAGSGTFTRALVALFGPTARVYAVDQDPQAVAAIRGWATSEAPGVVPVVADLSPRLELPGLGRELLDGVMLANALHFVPDAAGVLAGIAARLRRGGRLVIVEYDRRRSSRWVPYPLPPERLSELAAHAGFSEPLVTATKRSRYGGPLYVAAAERERAGQSP
jgi:SAM-dependent methyltransferase